MLSEISVNGIAMRVGWCAVVVLVFFSLCHGQGDFLEIGSLAPKHHYDCGVYGMQLLVFPSQGRHIHFKVVGKEGFLSVYLIRLYAL